MRTKRKLSLTIDENVFQAFEEAAARLRIAKSHLAQKAFQFWLQNETELLMAKGYEDMASEDQAFSEMTFQAQKETL